MNRGRYSPFNLSAFNAKLDHGLLLGLGDADHNDVYYTETEIDAFTLKYDTFAGDVYTLDTAGITLTAGTLTANILKATGDGTIWSDGTTGSNPTSGAGIRLMWIPDRKAFRCGEVTGAEWDVGIGNIGLYSFACGYDNNASATDAFVGGGFTNVASGDYSFIGGGYNSGVSGVGSFIGGGLTNTNSGNYSFIGGGISLNVAAYADAAFGRFNVGGGASSNWVATDPVFEIGIGTANDARANALTVLKNGNATFSGTLGAGAITGTSLDAGSGAITTTGIGHFGGNLDTDAIFDIAATDATHGIITQDSKRFIHSYGTENLFIGEDSGNFTLTEGQNTGIGKLTLNALGTAQYNVAIGCGCLEKVAGATGAEGDKNVALGALALNALTTGEQNMAIGFNAMRYLTTASNNVGIGVSALAAATFNSDYNVMIGTFAGLALTSGHSNVGIGYVALRDATTGNYNVAIGREAGNNIVGLSHGNTLIGRRAGYNITSGDYNTMIGYRANEVTTTGNNNIIIGNLVDASAAAASDELNIGGIITGYLAAHASGPLVNLSGGLITNITEVTAATYAVLVTDYHISIQYTDTGTHTITLPAIAAANHGQIYHLKDADYNAGTNNIIVNTTGADTIEENASGTMNSNGQCWTLVANNTTKNWEIQ